MNNANQTLSKPGLPEPTADVATGLNNLAEFGVTIHKGFLTEPMREALLERILEQADMERKLGLAILGGPGGPQGLYDSVPNDDRLPMFQNVEFLPNKGRVFLDLMMDETAKAYATGVFSNWPHKLWAFDGLISRRGIVRQGVHIDQIGIPPALALAMPSMINIFICLSDFEAEMGATMIAPGTHRRPRPQVGVDDQSVPYFPAIAKAGDAIIWEGRTWHGGGAHTSDKTRHAISLCYCLYAVSPQEVYTSILQDRVHETLSPEELNMLGFSVQSGGYAGRLAPRTALDQRTNCNRTTPFVPELHRT